MSSPSDDRQAKIDELARRGIRVVGPTYAEDTAGRGSGDGAWGVVAHLPSGTGGDATVAGHGASPDGAVDDLLARLDTGAAEPA